MNPKQIVYSTMAFMISASAYFIYFNFKYMDDIAASRVKEFEESSGIRITDFKTQSTIPETIKPEYVIIQYK
ncbi:hypothetical protein pb186bvf_010489 [Paramecium bursaria]